MKAAFLFKVLIWLPSILFFDYLLMVVLGCTGCLFGMGDNFYCGTFCVIGKFLLGISLLIFLLIIFPDVKQLLSKKKHGQTP